MTTIWGVHNDTLSSELVDEGFISIGWDELGDLNAIGPTREALKAALAEAYPERKPGAIPVEAGILYRFAHEMKPGDIVVAPYKADSTINIGVISGGYQYAADAPTHRNRRKVDWKLVGLPRTTFTQPALYEIGAFITIFKIRNHAEEFRAALDAGTPETAAAAVIASTDTNAPDANVDEPRASRVSRHTRDFVLARLQRPWFSDQEFEEFTADLLRALGYQARVTPYSQDGGVDVIAHRDPLGVEPPLIKVQCKHQIGTIGAPEVQQLVGTQAATELGLFVTLGTYSKDALAIERTRQGLRLINGEALVDLVLQTYPQLPARWRSRIPLTPLLVVDDSADG